MATKTTLTMKEGATYILSFIADSNEATPNFTGWVVHFIVKKTLKTSNADAIINQNIAVNATTGLAEHTFSDETTATWGLGSYVYAAAVVDADGQVAKTENGKFVVEESAYIGAIA